MNSGTALRDAARSATSSLAGEADKMAERLAHLLGAVAPESPPIAEALRFLRSLASSSSDAESDQAGGAALERLAQALALAPVERDLFILSGLAEEHEGYASVFRQLHPRGEPRATVGLAAQVLCESSSERRMLREVIEVGNATRRGLVNVLNPDLPFFERTLVSARDLWPVLHGVDVFPAELTPLSFAPVRSGLDVWLRSLDVERALRALRARTACSIVVTARSAQAALFRALALAAESGAAHAAFAWPRAPEAASHPLENLLSLHCLAREVVPVLRLDPKDQNERVPSPTLSIHPGPLILCTGDEPLDLRGERPVLAVGAEALKHSERSFAWRELFPDAAECAALLAARYTLEPARVAEVVADVSVEPDRRSDTLLSRVAESVRVRSTRTLSAGVELLRARAGWNDLVLTPEQHTQLREAVDRLLYQSKVLDDWGLLARKRGARGVRMLFAGPPGTGKTLSAEVLAHELGVDLLLVDLSRVVSKWIGETEKNLAQVFEAAEESQTVLLFDEADALFGKRTEVSDARDRYANLETAYLLTRLETFEGLAVLSTNLRNNIDAAFTRRLEFIIDFPEPGVAQREALWRAHLPPAVPLASDVDFAEVAGLYPLVGGSIRNAAVASAFMAASQRTPVTRDLVVRAIRREYHKSGKAFPGAPVGMMNEATARTACPH